MISKHQALHLLEDAFDIGNPVMVHGTSVEATIELLKTGNLPSSFNPYFSEHPTDQNYLFFVPRKQSFSGHPLYDDIKIDLDGGKLEDSIKYYAENTQGIRFLIDELGYWPPDCMSEEFEPYGNWTLYDLMEAGVDTKRMIEYGLRNLYNDVNKRKGVCIGINDRIFDLDIKDGADEPGEEVMVHLPSGLNMKYVHYIYPLGELEDNTLQEFVVGLPETS